MSKIDPALAEFIAECDEIIQRVTANLQKMEQGSQESEVLDALYRDMHTMKGSAQLFGYKFIARVAHALEASLDPIRKTKIKVSSRLIDCSLKSLDLIDRMVKDVQEGKSDQDHAAELEQILPLLIDAASAQFGGEFQVGRDLGILNEKPVKIVNTNSQKQESDPQAAPVPKPSAVPPPQSGITPMTNPIEAAKPAEKPTEKPAESSPPGAELHGSADLKKDPAASAIDTSIRVQVTLLDRLMNLVGELVLVRNQVLQYQNREDSLEFLNLSKSLDVVTSELQAEVMKTRMQPIGNVVNKFQRVVRDIAKDLNKKIDLTLQGTETELDKTLLEAIKDPLTHIIRNSCDHGIELPAERKAAGKPENGHALIRSFHEGGQVVIEISDDGKGLDKQKLVSKAVEKGLINAEQASKMSEREAYNLIFLPGFSTAKQVTSVSGRGVGMDVVKTNIEKIGGAVELSSVLGKGTTIRLKIPLTLAIVPAMIIRSGAEKYAIPQVKLVELVRVEASEGKSRIEYLQGRPMFRLRGSLLPLVDLRETLGENISDKEKLTQSQDVHFIVLNSEGDYFGLIVEEILDTADIVVKPLSSVLKGISIFSGATLMGDGSVALILDVMGIAQAVQIQSKKQTENTFVDTSVGVRKLATDSQEFLLFRVGEGGVHSIPLCLVHRLEEFGSDSIELSGKQKVVQYRGALLPILSLSKSLGYETPKTDSKIDRVPVVVVQRSGRNYGIEVSEILDVVTIDEAIDDTIRDRAGILGNVVYQNEVVVVVDALGIIESETARLKTGGVLSQVVPAVRNAFEEIKSIAKDAKNKKVKILFAEDVAFFRKQVAKVLTDNGYEVTVVEDGKMALEMLESSGSNEFNILLSDIEMPRMNGLELARAVRKNDAYKNIPMIALTTRFRDKDVQDGLSAGFNAYLEKLNPDKLLNAIQTTIQGGGRA